ncbi:hypothetical protein V501_02943 [Pseudogymnoascus sp. VKM F-4519 (FW-2642)]|nr:hypothetical protein V501_02943 [Pseudogymnoascus sp. VKM F-4519 (FW-2642)]
MHDATGLLLPPVLQPNPDISGIGVLIGFVGIAYVTFILLVLQYLLGKSSDTNLDGSTNPIDEGFRKFIWGTLRFLWGVPRRWAPLKRLLPPLRKPSARFGGLLVEAILAMSDAQIVTGLSILIGGFSQINCGLSIFHWHMVVRLAWFSSVTHLTTLTFLRRYIQDNRAIRILRLVLMLVLMPMLAVALIPTGGECGLENYERTKNKFDVMMVSEAMLIGSSLTRVFKLFRGSSEFSKTWLRHKPAKMCKRIASKLEERYYDSYLNSARGMYIACYCAIMAFITFARAIYDCVDSLLFEIFWLLFSLAWGTLRIFLDRMIAGVDFAITQDSKEDVVLQENSWGLLEGAIGILKSKSTNSIQDDTASALDEARLSKRPSEEEQPRGLPPCTGPYVELDIVNTVEMVKLLGTGADLADMERTTLALMFRALPAQPLDASPACIVNTLHNLRQNNN